jgi:hypothetical protein
MSFSTWLEQFKKGLIYQQLESEYDVIEGLPGTLEIPFGHKIARRFGVTPAMLLRSKDLPVVDDTTYIDIRSFYFIDNICSKEEPVYDLCCGELFYSKFYTNIIGIDIVNYGWNRVGDIDFTWVKNHENELENFICLFPQGYLANHTQVSLNNISNMLKPKGYGYFSMSNFQTYGNSFSEDTIRELSLITTKELTWSKFPFTSGCIGNFNWVFQKN